MEKGLGVLVDNKLKCYQHINETVNKSNKLVGMIAHYISFKTSIKSTHVPRIGLFRNVENKSVK